MDTKVPLRPLGAESVSGRLHGAVGWDRPQALRDAHRSSKGNTGMPVAPPQAAIAAQPKSNEAQHTYESQHKAHASQCHVISDKDKVLRHTTQKNSMWD